MKNFSNSGSNRYFARQIVAGFGAVGLVAVLMSAFLIWIVQDVSNLVSGMRHDEHSIRQGLELATAVRQESVQIGRVLVDPSDENVRVYEALREQVRHRIQQLAGHVPEGERWRLEVLGERTQQMHARFLEVGLRAAREGRAEEVRGVHRELSVLAEEAAEQADALARVVEGEMAHAHDLATDATRVGLLGGFAGVVLMVVVAAAFSVRLREEFLKPLEVLAEAARRLGQGDFETRVGVIGTGELADLSLAFDRMFVELEQRQTSLLRAERMAVIGQLAAGVAHELNNPIGIIRGYLKTMSPESDAETLREELAILDEEAAQCQRIADDLLSYARSEELQCSELDLGELIEQTVRRFSETELGRSSQVRVDVELARVFADGTRLRQVIMNLLGNAAHASGSALPIDVRGRVEGGEYVMDVEDQGSGVEVGDRERIFEPFFSKRRGGSGLGLSVVQGIVRAHGGRIDVTDGVSRGARFTVRLPMRKGA